MAAAATETCELVKTRESEVTVAAADYVGWVSSQATEGDPEYSARGSSGWRRSATEKGKYGPCLPSKKDWNPVAWAAFVEVEAQERP